MSPDGGGTITFANGDPSTGCAPAAGRSVTYNIVCAQSTSTSYTVTTQGSCGYTVTINHSAGCPSSTPLPGPGGKSGGLSGGSIFLIILVVLIPVYIAVGCIWKRTRMGAQGMEACPNIDFWKEVPGWILDGFKFTWRKLLGLCGKGDRTSYASQHTRRATRLTPYMQLTAPLFSSPPPASSAPSVQRRTRRSNKRCPCRCALRTARVAEVRARRMRWSPSAFLTAVGVRPFAF
jgi:hypothetical protein